MKKALVSIKKFFAIIFSFIFGLFHKSVDKDLEEIKEKDTYPDNTYSKKKYKENRLFSEDESTSKNISSSKNNESEILYFARKDIQKLMIIQDYIVKLESEIENCNDLETLEYYKNQLEKEKNNLKKITTYYEKINLNNKIIIDIKTINATCTNLVRKCEKELDKKTDKLKQQLEEKKQSTEIVEKTNNDDSLVEKEDKTEEEKKEISKEKKNTGRELLEEIVIIDTIIKEEAKIKKNQKLNISSDKKDIKKEDTKRPNVKIENKGLDENIEKKSNTNIIISEKPKKYKINKQVLDKNIEKLKLNKKIVNVAAVSMILAQAKAIVGRANINQLINLNSSLVVNTLLTVNNQIRRSRSLLGRKVKKLKLEKVIRKVGPNPIIQVRAIIGNSLSELRKLKAELMTFGMVPEVIEALNTINELEFELLSQVNELESQNNLNRNRTR